MVARPMATPDEAAGSIAATPHLPNGSTNFPRRAGRDPSDGGPPAAGAWTRFVGRAHEMAELHDDLANLPHPAGPVRLLCGPPGIGKTRLAEEVARSAADRGLAIAWAHGPEGLSSPPYWSWTQIVRSLSGQVRGTDLAALVLDDPDGADRIDVFDAAAAVVRAAAVRQPLLIILDDLHAADEATIRLTRFLARHLRDAPVLLVATVRTIDVASPLSEHLDALARSGRRIHLGGLPVESLDELLEPGGHAAEVHAVTGGNPLHVHQLIQELRGTGFAVSDGDLEPGDALRRTVRRRISSVQGPHRTILDAAAVLGGSFDATELIELVEPIPAEQVMALLRDLALDGFVTVSDQTSVRHPLIAETVMDEMADPAKRRLHHRAAELLRTAHEHDGERIGELAHHLVEAGPEHQHEAVRACRSAAALATRALAHEVAVSHLTRARETLHDHPDDGLRLPILLDLGAALWRAGRTSDADAVYEKAWEAALVRGQAEDLSRAVLRNGLEYYFAEGSRPAIPGRVELALQALPEDPSPTRARLLAELATHHLGRTVEKGRGLAEAAVEMARRFHDPLALGNALIARQVTDLGPSTLARRIADAHEILGCARRSGDYRQSLHGRFLLMVALLEEGDISGLDGELRHHDVATEGLGEPRYERFGLWLRATRSMFSGDTVAATALADQTFEISTRMGDPDAVGVYGGQIGVIRWMQGRVTEMEQLYLDLQAQDPHEPLWPAVLAWLWATNGQPEAARGALELVADPATVPSGMHWLLTASTWAEAVALVGDDEQVDAAWSALLPYADRMVPVAMGAAVWGTTAKPLGLLALRRGDVDEGIANLRQAMRTCARLGARPWLVEAQLDLADALELHRPHDPSAAALRTEAAQVARRLGLDVFLDRLRRGTGLGGLPPVAGSVGRAGTSEVTATREAEAPSTAAAAGDIAPRPSIRVIGGLEVRGTDGEIARWTSRKARDLLKVLVARRGSPIGREQLMDLLWPDQDPATLANRLSVALSTVRRALDPGRSIPAGDLVSTGEAVSLDLSVIDVDVEHLLERSRALLARSASNTTVASGTVDIVSEVWELLDRHRGEALPEEPHADWAEALRNEVRLTTTALARLAAEAASAGADHMRAAEAHRRILDLDPYDEVANLGLTAAFRAMGAHGQAAAAYDTYRARMDELGVKAAPEL